MARKGSKIYQAAKEIYGEEDAKIAIKSMDIIGDIAIIKVPDELLNKRFELGQKLLEYLPYIKTIFRQKGPVKGGFRLRELEFLAGEFKTLTIYKEYGSRFLVDVLRTYFTPRLSTERRRITDMVGEGERVLNMFAGVGPYSILIAKHRNIEKVVSIDINYEAVKLHRHNNHLNKVEDKIEVFLGDAEKITYEMAGSFDRIIMPLPDKALDYIHSAVNAIDSSGWIHVYLHREYRDKHHEAMAQAMADVLDTLNRLKVKVKDFDCRRVREVATRTLQVCVDTFIAKNP
jgi:tRNA (guanine37-N1)-methyltransferase